MMVLTFLFFSQIDIYKNNARKTVALFKISTNFQNDKITVITIIVEVSDSFKI